MSSDANGAAGADAVAALRRLIAAGEQFRHAIAGQYGVGESETMALTQLRLAGSLTPRELAAKVGLTPSAMTSLLDRLEAAGLAKRSAHPTDRRKSVVTITKKGHALLARSDKSLSAALGGADPMLVAGLGRVAVGLEEQTTALRADAGS